MAAQQHGGAEMVMTLPNFNPMGIMGPGVWTQFFKLAHLMQKVLPCDILHCSIEGYKETIRSVLLVY